jgi:dTDP-4-amino-4,6-dideoxy-D-galactose acyltransferase
MTTTTLHAAEPAIVRLEWESRHFSVAAAQLSGPDVNDAPLAEALSLARRQGVQLLVWPAQDGRDVPRELLEEFGGSLVDRKATFFRHLQPALPGNESQMPADRPVIEYAAATTSAALIELAISAGVYSRFHLDPHFTDGKFAAMYQSWIERSVTKELADIVLVVPLNDHHGAPADPLGGMITLSESSGVATIGLLAVAATVQGRGIGSSLMRAAESWMRDRGAREARVVTQLANRPACRLYARSGYFLLRVQYYYHFWLQGHGNIA